MLAPLDPHTQNHQSKSERYLQDLSTRWNRGFFDNKDRQTGKRRDLLAAALFSTETCRVYREALVRNGSG